MAASNGMIEPFEPGQVRVDKNNERIVSYGTSSYGYDVRCADEFKIFTNINHAIVDPKAPGPGVEDLRRCEHLRTVRAEGDPAGDQDPLEGVGAI